HDQEEALTMSDRIAVMEHARVAQLGTPAEIYESPRTAFVAQFIGESNFLEGTAARHMGESWEVVHGGGSFRIPDHPALRQGHAVQIAVRPEWMTLYPPQSVPPNVNALAGRIRDLVYLGQTVQVIVDIPAAGDIRVALRNEGQLTRPLPWKRGDSAVVAWQPEDCQILEQR
ncbi:MAG TPA: TOBE domain-containing protein, partial [Gemmatimonadales bacterium]|nr:TOBE domain-containing protein [Gemmatimonadales bacterium]